MTTVLVHGCFDVIHAGHIALLNKARETADRVVVSLTADAYVNKGPNRPVNSEQTRFVVLSALRQVDEVTVCYSPNALPSIRQFKPDFYLKGDEYEVEDTAGFLAVERMAVEANGGKVIMADTMLDSSSRIANITNPSVSQDAWDWISGKKRDGLSWEKVRGWLETASQKEVTVAGEVITDRYVYLVPHGKSPKEPVITWTRDDSCSDESWTGGAYAIMQHVVSAGITNYRLVGNRNNPVVKERRVHRPFMHKVFSEAYVPELEPITEVRAKDVAIIADFGHGLFKSGDVKIDVPFKALTVQSNSLNWGMNRINKWNATGCDYLACDEPELRLAVPDEESVEDAALVISNRLRSKHVLVTQGHRGALYFNGGMHHVPAFTERAADRIGAGDAFLGTTAALVAAGAPPEVVLYAGSCAASLHVQTPGNGVVSKGELYGYMKAVLA